MVYDIVGPDGEHQLGWLVVWSCQLGFEHLYSEYFSKGTGSIFVELGSECIKLSLGKLKDR